MPDKDRVPAGQYMAGDLSMAGEDTTERRRAPLELHINTILTGVITAGIIGLAAMLWNMYTELVKINQVINTFPQIYSLKSEIGDLRLELERLRSQIGRHEKTP